MNHSSGRPPPIDGLAASHLQLPQGPWPTVLDALCDRFPAIPREAWRRRMVRGRVLDAGGRALGPATAYRVGLDVYYYREVDDEPAVPFALRILHADAHLLVVDKPHFLPVTPAGGFVRETVLARLQRETAHADLVPLHRIDRATAGLVLFSINMETRDRYQALFRERRIEKLYEALAPPLPHAAFPLVRRTRLARGEPFFRMTEVEGAENAETRIDVIERGPDVWRYVLQPVTGKKHQLRVHMAAVGAGIVHDRVYPQLQPEADDDHARPLKLLAKSLRFIDPVSGERRSFESRFRL